MSEIGRREFITAVGIAAAFGRVRLDAAGMRVGYAAITWGGNDAQAIDEIAEVGYRGIQLRASAFDTWGSRYCRAAI
jgi:inosose dehydratase